MDNEGVSSLNFQEGDKEQFQSGRVPATRGARKVYIHDGTLGLSSHSGIHGNNASQVYIENVKVRDWEVSGIHLNGCRRCTVKGCEVGPTSSQVPARATFSNARFLELYTSRLKSTKDCICTSVYRFSTHTSACMHTESNICASICMCTYLYIHL